MTAKIIVSTTINAPTEAIRAFDAMPDWHLVVVGDVNTPTPYRLERGTYLSPEWQEDYDKTLSDAIGWRSIQRRNVGFLYALDQGAEVVATVDDDNIPLEGWGASADLIGTDQKMTMYGGGTPIFDPLWPVTEPTVWHRGFPLTMVRDSHYQRYDSVSIENIRVVADLWNGDPDLDAIGRWFHHNPRDVISPTAVFPYFGAAPAVFNSQNTFLAASVLRDYFMFPEVGRMDDIFAAYYLQAATDVVPVFNAPSVRQNRNPHDPISDLIAELPGLEYGAAICDDTILRDPAAILNRMPQRSRDAFAAYRRHFGEAR
jgi:hypothetical protein